MCACVSGHVLSLLRGKAGSNTAVYEVLYENSDSEGEDACEVDHLVEDYLAGDIKFIN
jgi:hypothetical protein